MKERTVTVAVRIPESAYAELQRRAKSTAQRRSDVLRDILCAGLTPHSK
jgi:metal-responsive CopG/Arc/MetJ family transcriptional regulator